MLRAPPAARLSAAVGCSDNAPPGARGRATTHDTALVGTPLYLAPEAIHTQPTLPSERLGLPLPAALRRGSSRAWRRTRPPPASAAEAAARLVRCDLAGGWTRESAQTWWAE